MSTIISPHSPTFRVVFLVNSILKVAQDVSDMKAIKFAKIGKKNGNGKKGGPNQVYRGLNSPLARLIETLTLRYCVYNK